MALLPPRVGEPLFVDFAKLEHVLAVDQPLLDDLDPSEQEPESEPEPDWARHLDQILPLLDRLSPVEADCFELTYVKHCRQVDIAEIQGVTQGAISYRLMVAKRRLRFLLAYPVRDWTQAAMLDLLEPFVEAIGTNHLTHHLAREKEGREAVEIFVRMLESTCQSTVARERGCTQARVRIRFVKTMKALTRLVATHPELQPVLLAGEMVRSHPNILSDPAGGYRAVTNDYLARTSQVAHVGLENIASVDALNRILG